MTFQLEDVTDGTRITVTEEGFDALPAEVRPAQMENNTRGWKIVLDGIAADLKENHAP